MRTGFARSSVAASRSEVQLLKHDLACHGDGRRSGFLETRAAAGSMGWSFLSFAWLGLSRWGCRRSGEPKQRERDSVNLERDLDLASHEACGALPAGAEERAERISVAPADPARRIDDGLSGLQASLAIPTQ